MKVSPGAASHQDGGDALVPVQGLYPVNEGGDGLHVPVDDPLHQGVPDHEIGGAGILVNEKQGGAGLHALHHIGRLGGAAAGVFRGKGRGVLAVGQVADPLGNVCASDASAILSPDFHGSVFGDHILPAVPGDVVVDPQLQRLQQGGLAVVAASHNQGDARWNAHAGDLSPVGQVQGDRQFRRRLEGHAVLHGTGGDAGGPGQNASVGHKGTQAHLGQGVPNVLLILRQIRHGLQLFAV